MAAPRLTGVHFVGSVCLADTAAVIERLSASFPPSQLRTIPDGETDKRRNFVVFQHTVFEDAPFVQLNGPGAMAPSDAASEDDRSGPSPPQEVRLRPLEYDAFAERSYAAFCQARDRGLVGHGVRFQVSLPTPANVLGNLVAPGWRARVEPAYVAALQRALRRIQDAIPARDLAVQWDMASEVAYLEGATSDPAWFDPPLMDGLVRRVLEVADGVDDGVEMGFHLCYGDYAHKHFKEPADLALLVDLANQLVQRAKHPVAWLHMPVPKHSTDPRYFEPLARLHAPGVALFLGLLHMDDEHGARERIKSAGLVVSEFGIATECGLGRANEPELDSVIQIAQHLLCEQGKI